MDATLIYLLLQALAGGSLFWSSFCRLTLTSTETLLDVRMAIWAQSVSGIALLMCPYLPIIHNEFEWAPLTTPTLVWIFVGISAAVVQIVTSRHWVGKVPRSYLKPEYRPMLRDRATDFQVTQ